VCVALLRFSLQCFKRAFAGGLSRAVDLYNAVTGTWTTAQLSVARASLAAASVGNVVMFAGGQSSSSASLCRGARWGDGGWGDGYMCVFPITLAGNLSVSHVSKYRSSF
jgi:hypothetical protein